jgi:hypothetical protein
VRTLRVLEAYRKGNLALPPSYSLEFDADMILLRSNKNAIVAAFGVAGIFPSEVTKAAWENYTRGRNDPPEEEGVDRHSAPL